MIIIINYIIMITAITNGPILISVIAITLFMQRRRIAEAEKVALYMS